jgi:hypothetical protein
MAMKRVAKKKAESADSGGTSVLRSLFRSFAMLVEQAAEGKPQLRGLRVAHDPKADRFVAVHLGARVEFLLRTDSAAAPPHAEVECRPVNSLGATGETIVARFRFNETGVVTESSVPELVGVRLDQKAGAWSVVAAVMWDALQAQP